MVKGKEGREGWEKEGQEGKEGGKGDVLYFWKIKLATLVVLVISLGTGTVQAVHSDVWPAQRTMPSLSVSGC